MLDQKRVQEAIGRVDNAIAQLSANRQTHLVLVSDLQMIQQCCKDYFDDEEELKEKQDVRTNEPVDDSKPGNENK